MASNVKTICLDANKRQLIRHQLLLILHCEGCRASQCSIPYCPSIKAVLQHMPTCALGGMCSVPHCLSCRQIRTHWNECFHSGTRCPVCSPFKEQRLGIVFLSQLLLNRQLRANIQAIGGKTNASFVRRHRSREELMALKAKTMSRK